MVRIADILPGTIAEDLHLEIGSRIVRINGELVRDTVDFRFMEAEATLEMEVQPAGGGQSVVYEIEKDVQDALGIIPETDVVRQCANKCVFCFVDGNPNDARETLYLKDDDFRLSFTYGSYVTLTNLGPKGFQRLIDQRLSPLYVSVHATEPELRERLLGVSLGGNIIEHLERLTSAGIEVHTQVVLCPGWNDGAHLDRTIRELYALGPRVLSLSVVPVGLTRYNLNSPVRLLTPAEACDAIERVQRAREKSTRERGIGWAYVGDEMFFIAAESLPEDAYYDDWPLTENGVGAVRRLLDDFDAGIADVPELRGQRIALVTGERMAPVLRPLARRLSEASGARVEVVAVENSYFGSTVTTAGLLPGSAVLLTLLKRGPYDGVMLPRESLNDDALFVDNVSLNEVVSRLEPARVVTGTELTSTIAELS
jgi:putative radical SAM enzyme (TIGR03279 family)